MLTLQFDSSHTHPVCRNGFTTQTALSAWTQHTQVCKHFSHDILFLRGLYLKHPLHNRNREQNFSVQEILLVDKENESQCYIYIYIYIYKELKCNQIQNFVHSGFYMAACARARGVCVCVCVCVCVRVRVCARACVCVRACVEGQEQSDYTCSIACIRWSVT